MSRRRFLGAAAATLGGVLLAPGVHLIELARASAGADAGASAGEGAGASAGEGAGASAASGANPAARWGMLIDLNRCVAGCDACVRACNAENGLDPVPTPTSAQWLRIVQLEQADTGRRAQLPVMCQHCAEPPCVDVCPTGASFKRVDGIVLVDRHRCIGCRYCMLACPYKARSFVHAPLANQRPEVPRGQGCVEGCTLCVHRIDRGQYLSACAEACAQAGHRAIVFGDLNDRSSEIAQRLRELGGSALRADLQLHPAVRYQGL